jgi:hypothetical protein
MDDLLDTSDCALMLGTSKQRVSELIKVNPEKYGAFKERGPGGGTFRYRERWRIPRSSVELIRTDMGRKA